MVNLQFQSTLPRGERLEHYSSCTESCRISIHAPTRGATNRSPWDDIGIRNFNPRSHEGSDSYPASSANIIVTFQSTLPRGERQVSCKRSVTHMPFQSTLPRGERPKFLVVLYLLTDFNPRSHEGSDFPALYFSIRKAISIHAPTRGATVSKMPIFDAVQFQSTLPRGERRYIF